MSEINGSPNGTGWRWHGNDFTTHFIIATTLFVSPGFSSHGYLCVWGKVYPHRLVVYSGLSPIAFHIKSIINHWVGTAASPFLIKVVHSEELVIAMRGYETDLAYFVLKQFGLPGTCIVTMRHRPARAHWGRFEVKARAQKFVSYGVDRTKRDETGL